MWKEGKMPMQQLAKELIEKGIIPADMDYKSQEAVQLAIEYNKKEMKKKEKQTRKEIKILTEKRKNLPPIDTWRNSGKTCGELMEMGYLPDEIAWGEDIDWFK